MTAKQAAIEAISRLPESAARADIFLAVFSFPEPQAPAGLSFANGSSKASSADDRANETDAERIARVSQYYATMRPFEENEDIVDPAYDLMALRKMDKPNFEFDGDVVD